MRPVPGRRAASDRGSATVWAVGAIAVLCAVFGAVLAFGQAVVIRHQAEAAADLAALAAADHWTKGAEGACATAERVAKAQDSPLVRCELQGEISDVTATSAMGPFTAESRARAGPPNAADSPAEAPLKGRGELRDQPHTTGSRPIPDTPEL
nr:Rv3654c family TadE-like protein [Streptomyces sp. ATCC 21386]